MVRSYTDSSKLFYTSTLSYTTDTILPGIGYALGDHSAGFSATPSVWQESNPPRNLFFTRLPETVVYEAAIVMGGTRLMLLYIACLEESIDNRELPKCH